MPGPDDKGGYRGGDLRTHGKVRNKGIGGPELRPQTDMPAGRLLPLRRLAC